MLPRPKGFDAVMRLVEKGVSIPSPLSLDLGEEVDVERISGDGVVLYPGCRIHGARTLVCRGARIGVEGPVTMEDCCVGPGVELAGGSFRGSVFLEGASMGPCAHVREGCILEEGAKGAHCVGLKQTLLFPFVTLGSLVNFCDVFMAGGTGPRNHSEVGSSYIHFNFTPEGDKATPTLLGDVPKGVMLNQPPIFLGGQGGLVGPLRLGFGNVVAAGSMLRKDCLKENHLLIGKTHEAREMPLVRGLYPGLERILENNLTYIAQLTALEAWYRHVRRGFLEREPLGGPLYEGLLETLHMAKAERIRQVQAMTGRIRAALGGPGAAGPRAGALWCAGADEVLGLLAEGAEPGAGAEAREGFLKALAGCAGTTYLETVRGLDPEAAALGTAWLEAIVREGCRAAAASLPGMRLFRRLGPEGPQGALEPGAKEGSA